MSHPAPKSEIILYQAEDGRTRFLDGRDLSRSRQLVTNCNQLKAGGILVSQPVTNCHRLKAEGSEVVTKCDQLKMPAADGKSYLTDVASAETLLRLVQSVPSL